MFRILRKGAGVVTAVALVGAAVGCSDFLDVNKDPNAPESVRMELTLPGVLVAFDNDILASSYTDWGTEWSQQWSYNRDSRPYSVFQHYEMTSIDTDGFWGDVYADVMQECKNIMEETEANEDWQYHGIAKFLFAWAATIVSDAFGPVPLSEPRPPTRTTTPRSRSTTRPSR
jgi:hypothetical protein